MTQTHEPPPSSDTLLSVALASNVKDAVAAALGQLRADLSTDLETTIVVPRGRTDELVAAAVDAVRSADSGDRPLARVAVLRSPGRAGALAAMARESWTSVPLGSGADRFGHARLPSRLLRSSLTVVSVLPPHGSDLERPVALLARFADPRQIAAAQLHGPDAGALAELAAPLPVRNVLLVGRFDTCAVAVATRDLLTAELAWEAFREHARDEADWVPWQAPVVQRLAHLERAARHPDEIVLLVTARDPGCERAAAGLGPWLGAKLGITDACA